MNQTEHYQFLQPGYDDTADIAQINKNWQEADRLLFEGQKALAEHQQAAVMNHPDQSVTGAKIANGAVTDEKIGVRSVQDPEQESGVISGSFTALWNSFAAAIRNLRTTLAAKADAASVLTKTNTGVYTPTQSYHPATKAYADAQRFDPGDSIFYRKIASVSVGSSNTRSILVDKDLEGKPFALSECRIVLMAPNGVGASATGTQGVSLQLNGVTDTLYQRNGEATTNAFVVGQGRKGPSFFTTEFLCRDGFAFGKVVSSATSGDGTNNTGTTYTLMAGRSNALDKIRVVSIFQSSSTYYFGADTTVEIWGC